MAVHLAQRTASRISLRTMSSASSSVGSSDRSEPPSLKVVEATKPLEPPAFYLPDKTGKRPHWTSLKGGFVSPWPSSHGPLSGLLGFLKLRWETRAEWNESPLPTKQEDLPSVRDAAWVESDAASPGSPQSGEDGKLRLTWIGHAGCHLQIPLPVVSTGKSTSRNINVLTDPVLSQRCSPVQFMGPARYTRPCTTIEDMAKDTSGRAWPDIVVLSHNHYDHMDYGTLKAFVSKPHHRPQPTFLVTKGLKSWFTQHLKELPSEKVVELDWWEERIVEVEPQAADETVGRLRFVCTPAQHFSSRSPFDRNQTLWGSWAIHTLPPATLPEQSSAPSPKFPLPRIWFSGDSGYRYLPEKVKTLEEEEKLPHCPAFKEIGDLLGPFDLALIACGAYAPRRMFSELHMCPRESVKVHQELRSRFSVGIHHSTFRLTLENVHEPAKLLLEEGEKAGLKVGPQGELDNLEIGETRVISVGSNH